MRRVLAARFGRRSKDHNVKSGASEEEQRYREKEQR
jgi:hypothetical protein